MNRFSILLFCAVLFGCGGMSVSSAPADPGAYQKLTQAASALVETHRNNAASSANVDACTSEHARYDAEMRPMIEKLRSQSAGMDSCMTQMGKRSDADIAATCRSMMSELDSHNIAACASADLGVDKTEAVRHCGAMKTWLDSAEARAAYLASSTMGNMSGGACK